MDDGFFDDYDGLPGVGEGGLFGDMLRGEEASARKEDALNSDEDEVLKDLINETSLDVDIPKDEEPPDLDFNDD